MQMQGRRKCAFVSLQSFHRDDVFKPYKVCSCWPHTLGDVSTVVQSFRHLRTKQAVAMKPSLALHAHREAIRTIVAGHRACNPRVFGSVVQGCDTDESDLDLLVDPTPETTLFDIGAIRHELLELLGVPVDVLTPKALPETFRATVLAQAVPV